MTAGQHKIYIWALVLSWLSVVLTVALFGFDYYLAPLAQRYFHPLYPLLKPSGYCGYLFGLIGTSMIVSGVVIYMLKKRVRRLGRFGPLRYWLEFHIFLCITGPTLVIYHTSFKVGGIALYSFFGMLCVMVSGITGRFLYGQLPRDEEGTVLSLQDLEESIATLTGRIKGYEISDKINDRTELYLTAAEEKGRSLPNVVGRIYTDRAFLMTLQADLGTDAPELYSKLIASIVKSKIVLHRKLYYLKWMQQVFASWHTFHLPFATVVISLVLVHVIGTFVLSYYGFFS